VKIKTPAGEKSSLLECAQKALKGYGPDKYKARKTARGPFKKEA